MEVHGFGSVTVSKEDGETFRPMSHIHTVTARLAL